MHGGQGLERSKYSYSKGNALGRRQEKYHGSARKMSRIYGSKAEEEGKASLPVPYPAFSLRPKRKKNDLP